MRILLIVGVNQINFAGVVLSGFELFVLVKLQGKLVMVI